MKSIQNLNNINVTSLKFITIIVDCVVSDRLFFASFCVLYLVFQSPAMNAIKADIDIE